MTRERTPDPDTAPNDSHEEVHPGERQLGDGEPQAEQPDDPDDPARRNRADGQLQ